MKIGILQLYTTEEGPYIILLYLHSQKMTETINHEKLKSTFW